MIDPALMQQLIAQRQAQMAAQPRLPFQFSPQMGMGDQPGAIPGAPSPGVNPYIQMLMQHGMMPQRPGMPMSIGGPPQGQPRPQMPPAAGGPSPAPQTQQQPQGRAYGYQGAQQGQGQNQGQGQGQPGGMDAYRQMFQRPSQGGGDLGRTPTGLPRLPQMGMPTGQQGPGSGRPY